MNNSWRAEIYVCNGCSTNPSSKVRELRQYKNSLDEQGIDVIVKGSGCFGQVHKECVLVDVYNTQDCPNISGTGIISLSHSGLFVGTQNNEYQSHRQIAQIIDGLEYIKAGAVASIQDLEKAIMREVNGITGHGREQYRLGQGGSRYNRVTEAPFIWNTEFHPYLAQDKKTGEIFFFSRYLQFMGTAVPTSELTPQGRMIYKSRDVGSELESHFFWDRGRVNPLFNVQQFEDGALSIFYGCGPGLMRDILVYKISGNRLTPAAPESLTTYAGRYSQWGQSNEFVWRDVDILPKSGLYYVVYRQNFNKDNVMVDEEGLVVMKKDWKPASVKVVRKNRKREFTLHSDEETNPDSENLFQKLVPASMR